MSRKVEHGADGLAVQDDGQVVEDEAVFPDLTEAVMDRRFARQHLGQGAFREKPADRLAEGLILAELKCFAGGGVGGSDMALRVDCNNAVRGGIDDGAIPPCHGLLFASGQCHGDGVVERCGNVFIRGADLDELQADSLGDPLGDTAADDNITALALGSGDGLFQTGRVAVDLLDEFNA